MSLHKSLEPMEHIRMGRALAPLRDEGVLILGSGMSYHNFGLERQGSLAFDRFLNEAVDGTDEETRTRRLCDWESAPSARAGHPKEEHLMPLMVCAGAAGASYGRNVYNGDLFGVRISSFMFD